ncbi:MAG: suppressor of fused domain protein [Pirellulaceae bacterium]|nr:suppressor of fused domain protein [Pirellulaceae bacterium]
MNFKAELDSAIDDGDLGAIRRLLEPSDLESNDYDGSLLHSAAKYGTLEIVKFLVESGAELDRLGGTWKAPAVTYAANKGRSDIVRYLVEAGSMLDMSHALNNPLMRAAAEGHLDVVEYLLTTNIDRHATYRTPAGILINALVKAEQGGHQEIAELLKAHGCHRPVEGVDIPLWEPAPSQMVNQSPEFKRSQEIIQYMEQRFGLADEDGIQEIIPVMEGISVSINIIRPNDFHPYLVLFTNGMSDLPMKVPKGQEAWQYAELVIHLPPDWKHPREAGSDLNWMWPIQWLRKMAYYPHQSDSWLGLPAALVSSDDPPVPLGPNTKQTCLLMVPNFSNLNPPLQTSDGRQINFFTVVPLYTEERDYELEHGMRPFFEQIAKHEIPFTVVPDRPNFAEK